MSRRWRECSILPKPKQYAPFSFFIVSIWSTSFRSVKLYTYILWERTTTILHWAGHVHTGKTDYACCFRFNLTWLQTGLCAVSRREHERQIGARLLAWSCDRPKSILSYLGIVAIDLLPLEPGDCNEKAFPQCQCHQLLDQLQINQGQN